VFEHFHPTLRLANEPHLRQGWPFRIEIQFDSFDSQANQSGREERSEIPIARQPGRSLIHRGCARQLSILPSEVEPRFRLVDQVAEKLQQDLCDVFCADVRFGRPRDLFSN
jgi:hypothetical protein